MTGRKSKRSAQGEGTIRKRSDGRWEARVTVGNDPGTGKLVRQSIYGNTQKEVQQKKLEMLAALKDGSYVQPSAVTVGDWVQTWLSEYTGNVKASTKISYAQHIANHIRPGLGAVKLTALAAPTAQRFYNDLLNVKRLSPKTIKNVHGVLHQALKQAQKLGYIHNNPTEACTLPRIERTEVKPLDEIDIRRLLPVLDKDEYATAVKVALFTGMREGEVLGLQWSCVDIEGCRILIDKQLSRPRKRGDAYRFTSLKNDKPRTICPAPWVLDQLGEHKKAQLAQRMQAGPLWGDEGFPDLVFTTGTGRHLCYCVLLKHFRNALKLAGLPETTRFHDLRHTYAAASLRAGDDIKTLQENLGHATPAFTMGVYAHVTDAMRDASAQRMEGFISQINR